MELNNSAIIEKIEKAVVKIKENPSIAAKFKEDPASAIKELIGATLSDDAVNAAVAAVRSRLTAERSGELLDAFKKLF